MAATFCRVIHATLFLLQSITDINKPLRSQRLVSWRKAQLTGIPTTIRQLYESGWYSCLHQRWIHELPTLWEQIREETLILWARDVGVAFKTWIIFPNKLLNAHDGTLSRINTALELKEDRLTSQAYPSKWQKTLPTYFLVSLTSFPKGGLGPGSRDTAHSSGRKRPAQPRGNAPEGEWAGTRARLKDGRRRPAATAPEVTLGPAASARAREPPPSPYHEASESPHPGPDLFSGRSRAWRGSTESTPEARGRKPAIFSAPRNSKIHCWIKPFTPSPRLRLFREDTLFRFLRKSGLVYSLPEPHLYEFVTKIPTNLMGGRRKCRSRVFAFTPPLAFLSCSSRSYCSPGDTSSMHQL